MTNQTETPRKAVICPRHNVPMYLRTKNGRSWYSHRHYYEPGKFFWCHGRKHFDWIKFDQEKRSGTW